MTQKWNKPDILIVNGDTIEGRQSRQGGAELITPDRNIQCNMAVEAIQEWSAKKIFMTYGSAYHVSEQAEDFEFNVADKLKAKIEGRLYLNIEGLTFDIRHKVNTSIVPHGRATMLIRELTWDLIKEAEKAEPKIDVIVRSHAHYFLWIEEYGRIALITPGLQITRGRYGSRECSGDIDWGMIRLTVHKGKIINRDVKLWRLLSNKPQITKVK